MVANVFGAFVRDTIAQYLWRIFAVINPKPVQRDRSGGGGTVTELTVGSEGGESLIVTVAVPDIEPSAVDVVTVSVATVSSTLS